MDAESALRVYRTAMEQIQSIARAQESGRHVILNGTRMTASRAIDLIADWAKQGVSATELMIVWE